MRSKLEKTDKVRKIKSRSEGESGGVALGGRRARLVDHFASIHRSSRISEGKTHLP